MDGKIWIACSIGPCRHQCSNWYWTFGRRTCRRRPYEGGLGRSPFPAGLRGEPRPVTRVDLAIELDHPLRNEPLQEQARLPLLVVELGISLAGVPGVEE